MRSTCAVLNAVAVLLIGSSCGTENTSPESVGTSGGDALTEVTSSSDSTGAVASTTGSASTTTTTADAETSASEDSGGSAPDVPLPSEPDGVVCGKETCIPGDSCNICNADGSSSCVPATGGAVCLDGWTLRCDGPEDCEEGQHCVFSVTQLGNMVSCADEDTFVVCDATPQIVCHDDVDCPSGCEHCVPSDDTTVEISFCRVVP